MILQNKSKNEKKINFYSILNGFDDIAKKKLRIIEK